MHREYESWRFRVRLYLASHASDEHIDAAVIGFRATPRNGVTELVTRQYPARTVDQMDVIRLLRLEVNRAGSQKKWAKKNGVTQSLISMVLSGDRPPNHKIIRALKLRRVVVYERLDRTAGRPSQRRGLLPVPCPPIHRETKP